MEHMETKGVFEVISYAKPLCQNWTWLPCAFRVGVDNWMTQSFKVLGPVSVLWGNCEAAVANWFHFLAHLSWKLKWAFLIAGCPSSLSICKLLHFDFFCRTTGPI
jgi:hypothetical protein